jgi:hypothetical protein
MNTVVALRRPARMDRDPALVVIEDYWNALKAWRAADRRIKRLRKKLPEELMRQPRVQVSWILRGRDNAGADIKEPVYAHSEWEIRERARENCKSTLSFQAPLYSWFVDPAAKGGIRKGPNKWAKSQRPVIRSKYRAWEKNKLAEFLADKTDLYVRQKAAGWRQAVEAEEAARSLVYRLRYRVKVTVPTTAAGALAMIEFIYAAYRSEVSSGTDRAPYGLSEYCSARIARNVAVLLRMNLAQAVVRRAA